MCVPPTYHRSFSERQDLCFQELPAKCRCVQGNCLRKATQRGEHIRGPARRISGGGVRLCNRKRLNAYVRHFGVLRPFKNFRERRSQYQLAVDLVCLAQFLRDPTRPREEIFGTSYPRDHWPARQSAVGEVLRRESPVSEALACAVLGNGNPRCFSGQEQHLKLIRAG